ncbi:MAG TPA: ketose-bisphosphate aldolase [Planctomycetota bacterium]|nr:ketose-bisphosphate aldolase [Planctomycetota bacterium]
MPLTPMRQILDEAMKADYGVGAYNVNNMEQIQAIMQAARETQSPVILQASRGALEYTSMVYIKHLMLAAVEENPEIPMAMHLDHGPNLDVCKQAIALGFTSVMIDGSIDYAVKDSKGKHSPRSFEDNIRVTKEVADVAHSTGVSVEGELGTLGGIEDDTATSKVMLTDPDQAAEFAEKTGIDCLALAIGTSHGAYKFKTAPKLAMNLIDAVRKNIPGTALVMHGSSSVPAELVDIINKHGGKLEKTMGVPIPSIQEAIKRGVRKINVDTDGRLAYTGALRQYLAENPKEFDQRKYLGFGRTAIYNIIKQKMIDFGTAGHAKDYKPLTLDDMRKFYASQKKSK